MKRIFCKHYKLDSCLTCRYEKIVCKHQKLSCQECMHGELPEFRCRHGLVACEICRPISFRNQPEVMIQKINLN